MEQRSTIKHRKGTDEIKISKNLVIGIFVVVVVLLAAGYMYYQMQKNVVAIVNGQKIAMEELDRAYNALPLQYKASVTKKDLLEQVVQTEVVYQEAQKEGIVILAEDIDAYIQKLKDNAGGEEAFNENLKKQELTEQELRDNYEKQSSVQKFLDEHFLNTITVSEDEARDYYNANSKSFAMGEQVVARHILFGDTAMTKEQQKAKAEEVLKQATKENFCDLVKEYSTDPGSKDSCGEYTFTKDAQYVEEFKELAFKQSAGQMGIVETQFGYHIIWTKEKIAAKTLSFAEVKDKIIEYLKIEKGRDSYKGFYDALAQDYTIKITYKE
ncbi:MAG: hypothetical protein RL557_58 [archaeon]|jgi:parvulin-like peptidyl-prolyl isomerase